MRSASARSRPKSARGARKAKPPAMARYLSTMSRSVIGSLPDGIVNRLRSAVKPAHVAQAQNRLLKNSRFCHSERSEESLLDFKSKAQRDSSAKNPARNDKNILFPPPLLACGVGESLIYRSITTPQSCESAPLRSRRRRRLRHTGR